MMKAPPKKYVEGMSECNSSLSFVDQLKPDPVKTNYERKKEARDSDVKKTMSNYLNPKFNEREMEKGKLVD
jgi:hypothetical protein